MLALILAAFSASSCGGPPSPSSVRKGAGETVVLATEEQLSKGEALPGSYIVTFRPRGGQGNLLRFASYFAEYQTHFAIIQQRYLDDPRVKDIRFLAAVDLAGTDDLNLPATARLNWNGPARAPMEASITRVDFTEESSAKAVLKEWDDAGELWLAEPNYISHLSQAPAANMFDQLSTQYGALTDWWLTSINLAPAFEAIAKRDLSVPGTPTDTDINNAKPIVAVLDSGVDYEHPALKNRMWTNADINAASCTNDLHGCNTTVAVRGKLGNGDVFPFATSGPGVPCDTDEGNCSHGTHVAGIIAADPSAGGLIGARYAAGMCPVCQIMALKIVSKVGKESGILDSSILAAFKYVTLFRREGSPAVRIINASFGKFVRSRTVGLLIRLMKDKHGTLLVAAAGNEDTLTQEFPAAFAESVAVSAVDARLRKVSFSNFGRWVDVAAPGAAIVSSIPGGGVDAKSGTSMASPIVAGVAGLIVARWPGIGFDELKSALVVSADPRFYRSDFEEGFNFNYYYPKIEGEEIRQPLLGSGLVNAVSAINRTPTDNLPLFTELDRVKPGCSTVRAGNETSGWFAAALLLFPALLAVVRRGRSRSKFAG